jgi:hypothetical protein
LTPPKLTVRPATREDIAAFSDLANKPTVRAWIGELDGAIISMGGIALVKGRWIAFVDLTEAARPYKMTIARTAIRFLEAARRDGIRFIYAEMDVKEKSAERWVHSLGFSLDPRSQYLFRWRA